MTEIKPPYKIEIQAQDESWMDITNDAKFIEITKAGDKTIEIVKPNDKNIVNIFNATCCMCDKPAVGAVYSFKQEPGEPAKVTGFEDYCAEHFPKFEENYEEPHLPPMPPCCVCGEPSEGAIITITNNTRKSWVTADEVKQKIDYYCEEHQPA